MELGQVQQPKKQSNDIGYTGLVLQAGKYIAKVDYTNL
jgi:hypothetical protein